MRLRKPKWAIVSLLAIASMVMSSCGGETAATPTAGGPGGLTGSISFQAFGDPAEMMIIDEIIKSFKVLNPQAEVNLINVPSQGDHMTKLSTSFAAGNPPDVWLLNYRRYGQFAAQGVIESAGDLLAKGGPLKEEMYYEEPLKAFRYNGKLQCIPQNVSSLVVYYNKDMFTQANIPFPKAGWTWNDFLSAASALTKDTNADGRNDVHGLGVPPQIIRVAPFVWQNSGEIVDNPDKPTRLTLSEGAAREAVQFFMDLQLVHKVVPNEAEEKAEDIDSRFMNGRLGMFMGSRVVTPTFREIKGFQWDVGPLPQQKQKASILHSDAYCISAASKNKDLAWAFVQYAEGPEGQTVAAKLGRTVPSMKSIAQSPTFLEPSEPPASSQVFLDAIPEMRLVPVISTWPKIETTVNEELERAFYGLVPIDEALKKAEDDTIELFAEAAGN